MDPQACAAFGRIRLFLSDLQLVLGGLANSPFYSYAQVPPLRGKPTRRSRAWMEKRWTAPRQEAQAAQSCTSTKLVEKPSIQPPPLDKASKGQRQISTQDGAAISRPRQLNRSLPFHCPAPPKPRPIRIQVTNPRAYMTCPSSLHQPVIRKIRYKHHVPQNPAPSRFCYRDQAPNLFDVDEDRERDDCSNRSHSQAESEVGAESDVEVDVGPHNQTLFGFPPVLVPAYLPGNDEFDQLDASSSNQGDNHDDADQTPYSDYHDHSNCEDNENFTELSNDLEQPETIEYTDNHDNTVYNNDNPAESDAYHDDPGEDCEEQMGDNEDGGYEGGGGYEDAGDHDFYDDGGYEAYQEEEYYGDYVCDEGGGYEAYQEEENYDYYETF